MIEALDNRHLQYNQALAFLSELEQIGKAFIIAPEAPLSIGRFEKNPDRLKAVWEQGFRQTKQQIETIRQFAEITQSEAAL